MTNSEKIYTILSSLLEDSGMDEIVDVLNLISDEKAIAAEKEKALTRQRQEADSLYEQFLLYANTYYPSIYTDEVVRNQMQLVKDDPNYTLDLYAKAFGVAQELTNIDLDEPAVVNVEEGEPLVTITTNDNGKKTTKTYTTSDLDKVLQSWDDVLSSFFDKYKI